jgi:type I restriction enzyme M protein
VPAIEIAAQDARLQRVTHCAHRVEAHRAQGAFDAVAINAVDDDVLSKSGVVRTIYDPAAGTGGMLSVADEYLSALNPKARLTMFGQELNDESYAICKADMLIKGQDVANIVAGNTLSEDGHPHAKFDYMLSNPPFGVEWKKIEKDVRKEHESQGYSGRFGPGLPRVSDGSLLFLMHLISKMRPAQDGGSRFGIVFNGSPLFTGGAGSGESEIRRHVLENDLVEAIIGLPTDMFYNTGISTYVWIVTNRKPAHRKGKVQLIDASSFWRKMRKSLGSKRKEMAEDDIATVTMLFGEFVEAQHHLHSRLCEQLRGNPRGLQDLLHDCRTGRRDRPQSRL